MNEPYANGRMEEYNWMSVKKTHELQPYMLADLTSIFQTHRQT